jgi:hypothetical protein
MSGNETTEWSQDSRIPTPDEPIELILRLKRVRIFREAAQNLGCFSVGVVAKPGEKWTSFKGLESTIDEDYLAISMANTDPNAQPGDLGPLWAEVGRLDDLSKQDTP